MVDVFAEGKEWCATKGALINIAGREHKALASCPGVAEYLRYHRINIVLLEPALTSESNWDKDGA